MTNLNPIYLIEGFKLKNYFLDPTGGNQAREAGNTEKIMSMYPTAKDLIAGLRKLMSDQKCSPKAAKKFIKAIEKLSDPKYSNYTEYREFVRKNLSGASGFWKLVAYGLCNIAIPGSVSLYNIYKVNRIEDQLNDQNADEALMAMNKRNFFR